MSSYPVPNSRDLLEMEYLELTQRSQELEKRIKVLTVENVELRSVAKGKTAYELKANILFKVDPKEFEQRKQAELLALKTEYAETKAKMEEQQKKLSYGR